MRHDVRPRPWLAGLLRPRSLSRRFYTLLFLGILGLPLLFGSLVSGGLGLIELAFLKIPPQSPVRLAPGVRSLRHNHSKVTELRKTRPDYTLKLGRFHRLPEKLGSAG